MKGLWTDDLGWQPRVILVGLIVGVVLQLILLVWT